MSKTSILAFSLSLLAAGCLMASPPTPSGTVLSYSGHEDFVKYFTPVHADQQPTATHFSSKDIGTTPPAASPPEKPLDPAQKAIEVKWEHLLKEPGLSQHWQVDFSKQGWSFDVAVDSAQLKVDSPVIPSRKRSWVRKATLTTLKEAPEHFQLDFTEQGNVGGGGNFLLTFYATSKSALGGTNIANCELHFDVDKGTCTVDDPNRYPVTVTLQKP